jgi:putative hydrolase of the HAD superfamily
MSHISSVKIPTNKLTVIAFDLDDTLYPERSYVLSGFDAVASWAQQEHEIPQAQGFETLRGLFESGVRGDTFNRWAASHGLAGSSAVPDMVEVYRSHKPDIAPYEDTVPCLEAMNEGFRLALITEGFGEVQARKLDALGLRDYFEFVHIGNEHNRDHWKPNSYPFQQMLHRMSVDGSQAAYLGDNPVKDFHGANKLNMFTVRVRRQDGLHAQVEASGTEFGPNYEVSNLEQFTAAIKDK